MTNSFSPRPYFRRFEKAVKFVVFTFKCDSPGPKPDSNLRLVL